MIHLYSEKSVRCIGQIVFQTSIENAPVAPVEGQRWKAVARDCMADCDANEMGRLTLRVLTFWGVRHVAH